MVYFYAVLIEISTMRQSPSEDLLKRQSHPHFWLGLPRDWLKSAHFRTFSGFADSSERKKMSFLSRFPEHTGSDKSSDFDPFNSQKQNFETFISVHMTDEDIWELNEAIQWHRIAKSRLNRVETDFDNR